MSNRFKVVGIKLLFLSKRIQPLGSIKNLDYYPNNFVFVVLMNYLLFRKKKNKRQRERERGNRYRVFELTQPYPIWPWAVNRGDCIKWILYLSFWQAAVIPVGMWVILTALSVTLACWPPAPPDRYLSIFRSDSLIWTWWDPSPKIGVTATAANEVWRRLALSKGEIRTKRWAPTSAFAYPYAYSPSTLTVALWYNIQE